ncbi:hypothetical protein [Deinococcus yavapaiensis]|uniref:Uncharacterized protein n=1 Tax=Deinococcus yavapaiensis KR-236 TaxID=694435 RepID=A0A318SB02_9DEIO|nr:hypothetical protein [Deinococcus yavapaiensis]PYE55400.1 hypothetical protein DES52_103233 [Deinococcus yavapaiensis KR-236]
MKYLLPTALLVSTFAVSAAAPTLPSVTFDAKTLGLPATKKIMNAVKREDVPEFFPPRRVTVTFGPQTDDLRELNVYPVAGLIAQYPETRYGVRTEIGSLRALLKERPAPSEIRGEMPFLPLPNAGQVLNAAVKYLDFGGGRGVRFLVAFASDVSPVTRAQVFYTYQGLTNDGKYYVSLQFPVNLAELPKDAFSGTNKAVTDALNSGDSKRSMDAYESHVARTKKLLNGLTNDARLTKIDAFVKSLQVR